MDSRGLRLGLLALALLAGGAPPAGAQVQEKRRELSRIQKDLEKTRAELEEFRRQEASLSRDLHTLENRNGETRRKIEAIQKNIRQAEQRRSQLRSRMGTLSLASDFWASALNAELRDYVRDLAGGEPLWGGRDLWAEAFRRAVILEKTRIIASLRGYRVKAEAAQEVARRKAVELKDKGRLAAQEEQSVRAEFERKQAAVAEAREKVASAEKRAKELEETKLALTQLLSRIGAAVRYERRRGSAAGLEVPKNSLPWPVAGVVSRAFGRERNPELNTWVIHQGVTFATRPGIEVAAVGPGRIIYAGPFRSYGKVVIVDHGDGFFSIYGELGEILQAKGSDVFKGEAIGVAGGQGDKGSLYLELRRGTEALDPMVWLEKKN
ncbi:MAG TPA: hypothetical protein DEB40_01870 [Elusimicrobia bacterium]|nr:hypothetical protein [Elusimicrobiota bacterium]HBT60477.1 hypothetical protein [Elusimicrobiota bacterium]